MKRLFDAASEKFQVDVTEELDQEVSLMCNLSDGLIEKGREEGMMQTLFRLVKEGILTLSNAAERAGMEPSEFEQKYKDETQCAKRTGPTVGSG